MFSVIPYFPYYKENMTFSQSFVSNNTFLLNRRVVDRFFYYSDFKGGKINSIEIYDIC